MITARIEDYLEELFLLESTGRKVTVTDLAERLKITKGTVTATVQKL
ncbi:MAG: MarR family transcriptional regulator, partial [Synergistaceae bacterium]|nr:MarR family transcriptional regulator [Synergistaceae bacterium]